MRFHPCPRWLCDIPVHHFNDLLLRHSGTSGIAPMRLMKDRLVIAYGHSCPAFNFILITFSRQRLTRAFRNHFPCVVSAAHHAHHPPFMLDFFLRARSTPAIFFWTAAMNVPILLSCAWKPFFLSFGGILQFQCPAAPVAHLSDSSFHVQQQQDPVVALFFPSKRYQQHRDFLGPSCVSVDLRLKVVATTPVRPRCTLSSGPIPHSLLVAHLPLDTRSFHPSIQPQC